MEEKTTLDVQNLNIYFKTADGELLHAVEGNGNLRGQCRQAGFPLHLGDQIRYQDWVKHGVLAQYCHTDYSPLSNPLSVRFSAALVASPSRFSGSVERKGGAL